MRRRSQLRRLGLRPPLRRGVAGAAQRVRISRRDDQPDGAGRPRSRRMDLRRNRTR
jgi:CDP-diacylglycerol--serine O-phosphatidyltransferase